MAQEKSVAFAAMMAANLIADTGDRADRLMRAGAVKNHLEVVKVLSEFPSNGSAEQICSLPQFKTLEQSLMLHSDRGSKILKQWKDKVAAAGGMWVNVFATVSEANDRAIAWINKLAKHNLGEAEKKLLHPAIKQLKPLAHGTADGKNWYTGIKARHGDGCGYSMG